MLFDRKTMIGAMADYVSHGGVSSSFQPMNANFGIIEPLGYRVKGGNTTKTEDLAKRSLEIISEIDIWS